MNKNLIRRIGFSLCGLLFGIFVLWMLLPVAFPYDRDLNTPTAVAKQFVNSVIAEDYVKAAGYWRPGDIANIEANSRLSFRDFCKKHFSSADYTVSLSNTGKSGAYVVGYAGKFEGARQTYGLYLVRYQGRWKIIEDRIRP